MRESDAWALIRRRRWLIAGVFLVTAGIHASILGSRARSFEADAVLRLRPRAAPTVKAGGIEGIELHDPFELPVLAQLILDPTFHEAVRARLAADSDPALAAAWRPAALELAPLPESGAEFLRLSLRDGDPARARAILAAAAATLRESAQSRYEEDLRRAQERLADRADITAAELRRREAGIRELRRRAQLPPEAEGVQAHRAALLAAADAVEMRLLEVEGEATEIRTRLELIAAEDGESPLEGDRLLSRLAGTPAAEVVERVATRLVEAELDLARLRGVYTGEHPELARAQARLDTENEIFHALFDAETPLGKHLHAALGRVADRWHAERLAANARLASLEQRRLALDALRTEKRESLARLGAYEGDLLEREEERRSLSEIWGELDRSLRDLELLAHFSPEVLQVFRAPGDAVAEGLEREALAPFVLLFATIVAAAAAYGAEYFDVRVHDGAALRKRGGVPCLAALPHFSVAERTLLAAGSPGPARDAFGVLASQVIARLGERRVLLVTGIDRGAGRSFVASQLARAAARLGERTLLVDADLREPTLHRSFGAPRSPGLVEWLAGSAPSRGEPLARALARALEGGAGHAPTHGDHAGRGPSRERVLRLRPEEIPSPARGAFLRIAPAGPLAAVARPQRHERLCLLPAGEGADDPAALLGSARLGELLDEARAAFSLVVIDAPPLSRAADAHLLARAADSILIVARAGVTSGPAVGAEIAGLAELGAPVIGAVLNGVRDLARAESCAGKGERAVRAG